ncbi:MAG: helix-turn-helix transcriptional regulator [Clostridiales bacterium]|nr:helix-turn-helix transcriptional regulator [Clostridiales bacterium]
MDNISKIVGDHVRAYRKKAGLSQEELADRANLHPTYISLIERGEKNVTLKSIYVISIALDISLEALFANIPPEKNPHTIPSECYNIILSMTEKQQQSVLCIVREIERLL